jgi:hypothetical protein
LRIRKKNTHLQWVDRSRTGLDNRSMTSPALQDLARGAIAPRAAGDLRIAQALDILEGYGRALAARAPGKACDPAALPYPKETIKWALLVVLGAIDDRAGREPLKLAFVSLAEWQAPADFESATFDSSRLRRRLDPLELAREFAAHATPEQRLASAVKKESEALIEELRRRGWW